MEWILIIEAIFKLIEQCQEKRSREEIEARLKEPGRLEQWALRQIIRQELGLRGKDLRAKVDEGMTELREWDEDDIAAFMVAIPVKDLVVQR